MSFETFGLCPEILRAVKAKSYKTPTPIQEKAIPHVLEGRDLLGCAQTGTGKTAAFALPILQRLLGSPPKGRHRRAIHRCPPRRVRAFGPFRPDRLLISASRYTHGLLSLSLS